jgi:hypothetical protein
MVSEIFSAGFTSLRAAGVSGEGGVDSVVCFDFSSAAIRVPSATTELPWFPGENNVQRMAAEARSRRDAAKLNRTTK